MSNPYLNLLRESEPRSRTIDADKYLQESKRQKVNKKVREGYEEELPQDFRKLNYFPEAEEYVEVREYENEEDIVDPEHKPRKKINRRKKTINIFNAEKAVEDQLDRNINAESFKMKNVNKIINKLISEDDDLDLDLDLDLDDSDEEASLDLTDSDSDSESPNDIIARIEADLSTLKGLVGNSTEDEDEDEDFDDEDEDFDFDFDDEDEDFDDLDLEDDDEDEDLTV